MQHLHLLDGAISYLGMALFGEEEKHPVVFASLQSL